MMLRLLQELDAHAQAAPDAPAVQSVGCPPPLVLSRHQLCDRIGAITTTIRRLLPEGSTVLLCYPNRPEYVAAFLGVLSAEATVLPMAADSAAPEIESAARRSACAAAIVDAEPSSALQSLFRRSCTLPELSENAVVLFDPVWPPAARPGPALLLHSSGTTSQPKIVRRDGASLDAVSRNTIRACGFDQADHVLAAVPLCHSYGMEHGLLAPVGAGSCVQVCERFDLSTVIRELRDGKITILPGVPFMFEMLCQTSGLAFPTLRQVYSAGAPLPRTTFDAFQEKFGLCIGQVYGATEIGSVTFNNPKAATFNPASVGAPMDDVSIRILDADDPESSILLPVGEEGVIAIRAPSMLSGYLDGEQPPVIDGHFLTGDLGTRDTAGTLTVTGRLKLLIDIGGRKVNPLEVESVLSRHPDVGACVVVPMRLSETVQRLKAILTPAAPDVEVSVQAVRRFAREHLSAYKVPRVFEIRPSLPTSPAGKVLRRLVETP
ncbi:MAG TPA: class I adenylate-forming enzyme family protein [Tepidisphaeraceae bacterium]|jgi:long-chain acyl-CoA synthetase|nr:class I adenylate-forming enzyme family protein [Tepidisphaeraceae bacterium]